MAALSSSDQFQRALSVAALQFKKGKISVRFGPTAKLRFVIDEPSLKEALAGSGVEENSFREVFDVEIGPLLEAVMRGNVEQYADAFLVQSGQPETAQSRATRKATLMERARAVQASIVDPRLTGRYLIKTTSKHPRLRKSEWEVARKSYLSSDKEASVQPYATLSFETIRPEWNLGPYGWFPFFPSEAIGKSEHCTFDCDEGDLEDLIQTFQDAKAALHKATNPGVAP
jgi:hypothetical protein